MTEKVFKYNIKIYNPEKISDLSHPHEIIALHDTKGNKIDINVPMKAITAKQLK